MLDPQHGKNLKTPRVPDSNVTELIQN